MGPDTFQVAGTFLLEARDKYPAPEPPIGHADGPVRFRPFAPSGTVTVRQVGPDSFRVLGYGKDGISTAITAYHEGDDTYRYAEQPARLKLPANTQGKPQTITFRVPAEVNQDAEARLDGSTDSGLALHYAVNHGPAVIQDGRLLIRGIPPRAKFPLSVRVTAYQWGSAVEPRVQTAEPVSRTLLVTQGP